MVDQSIQLFEDQRIRTAWDAEQQEWYFSIVDVCDLLSFTDNLHRYWSDQKSRLKEEGADQMYGKIVQLKSVRATCKKATCTAATKTGIMKLTDN